MWKLKEENLTLICDVGSATVSAGLVLFIKNQKPKIVYTVSFPILISDKPNPRDLESLMIDYLTKAVVHISKEGLTAAHKMGLKGKEVDAASVVFASPWYSSKATMVTINQNDVFVLDEALVTATVKDEEKKFEDEAVSGTYEQIKGQDVRMVEREMVKVLLNGYETANPYGKKAKNAEISLYMSLIPEHILVTTEKIIKDSLHVEQVGFHTFPLSFFGAVSKLYPHNHNYILVDVAGESMDFSLVRNGAIDCSCACLIGKNTILRALMKDFVVGQDIAESYVHLIETNSAEEGLKTQVSESLRKIGSEIQNSVVGAFQTFGNKNPIPSTCFFVCNADISGLYSSILKSAGEQCGVNRIIEITPEQLSDKVLFEKFVAQDQFLALETLNLQERFLNSQ